MTSFELQLPDDQAARVDRFAQSVRKSRRDAALQLLEEALRHAEFPAVEFRESPQGRQAYVVASSLAVWELLMIAEDYALDSAATAAHLHWPESKVREVLHYAKQFAAELEPAIAENRALAPMDFRSQLPAGAWLDTSVPIPGDGDPNSN